MKGFWELLKMNAPAILSVLAIIGVGVTTVLTATETPRAMGRLVDAERRKDDALSVREKVNAAAPAYFPAAGALLGTVLCVAGAGFLSRKNQASLASAFCLLDRTYRAYRVRMEEFYGEKAGEALETLANADIAAEDFEDREEPGDSEKIAFYVDHNPTFFESTLVEVLQAEYHINRNFQLKGRVSLNEFFGFLGLKPVPEGDRLVWDTYEGAANDGYVWIDFSHRYLEADDGMRVCVIEMDFPPQELPED